MAVRADAELDGLFARLADGERSVFGEIFARLWPPALRLCKSLLHNEADAADAAQEAMEKVFTRAHQYDPTRPALPWALAIVAWECRTSRRKHSRRRELPEEAHVETASGEAEEAFARRQLVHAAIDAMGALSEADREVLIATFWEEAASVSGATLRKRRERALSRLKQSLKKLYGFD